MQLTKFSDYALRILVHLSATDEEQLSARRIAEAQGLPFSHIAKIAQWLAAEGYVTSSRGRGGGMRLARAPEEISVGELLRKSEASSPIVECMRSAGSTSGAGASGGACCLLPACGLVPVLATAQEAFFASLDATTLATVIHGKKNMLKLVRTLHERQEAPRGALPSSANDG